MKKSFFVNGPISPEFIANKIEAHQSKVKVGAHQIFLGQVRADEIENQVVTAIEYSAYEEMANNIIDEIKELAFVKYNIHCLHIYHSIGKVEVGQIGFFVFVSSAHRQACFDAMPFLVNEIKAKAPIFGKEFFENGNYKWKTSTTNG